MLCIKARQSSVDFIMRVYLWLICETDPLWTPVDFPLLTFPEFEGDFPVSTTLQQQPLKQLKVDIVESPTEYQITGDLPGVQKKDIKVTVKNDVLTIAGTRFELIFDCYLLFLIFDVIYWLALLHQTFINYLSIQASASGTRKPRKKTWFDPSASTARHPEASLFLTTSTLPRSRANMKMDCCR